MTTQAVARGYATPRARAAQRHLLLPASRHRATEHQTAHARCMEGIAANWYAWEMSVLCQEPRPPTFSTTSVKPASIRGGATGNCQKTAKPTRLARTRSLRSGL